MKSAYDQELEGVALRLSETAEFAGMDRMTIASILGLVFPLLLRWCFPDEPEEPDVQAAAQEAWDDNRQQYKRAVLARTERAAQRGSEGRRLRKEQKRRMAVEMLDTARRGPMVGSVKVCWQTSKTMNFVE